MTGYLPVVIYLGLIVGFAVVSLGMAAVLRPARPYAAKLENYECGAEPIGETWGGLLLLQEQIAHFKQTGKRAAPNPKPD